MAKPNTPAQKAKIRNLMATLKAQQLDPGPREFPKLGAFCSVKEYVEQYFQMNQPNPYSLSCRYVENYHNLSTEPVTL
jgi:hypothetical protein